MKDRRVFQMRVSKEEEERIDRVSKYYKVSKTEAAKLGFRRLEIEMAEEIKGG